VREIGGFSEHAYAHEDRVPLTVLSIEDIDAAISALNDRQQPENVTTVEDNNGVAQAGRTVPDEHPIAPQQCYSHPSLNIEQNDAFNQCMRWLQEDQSYRNDPRHCAAPDPLNVMILGGPGCGKSFFASKLIESAGSSVIHCCAPTGVAASLLPNGFTIHKLLGISIRTDAKVSDATLSAIGRNLRGMRILLIDEISMINKGLFETIGKRLSQVFPEDQRPFGGVGLVLMGDFFQLPATQSPLYALMLETTNPLAQFLSHFNVITFKQQMRAQSDPQHAELLERMRDLRSSVSPVALADVRRLKALSDNDFLNDPCWLDAPIVVTNNAEREAILRVRVVAFARQRGVPVIAWRAVLAGAVASAPESHRNALYSVCPELTQYFVRGAPVFVTDNISPESGLANGSAARLISITLGEGDSAEELQGRISDAAPGSIIMLTHMPLSVNIRLSGAASSDEETSSPTQLYHNNIPIIPLKVSRFAEQLLLQKKRIGSYKVIPFELGFAITFHKIQGQTVSKLILGVNRHPTLALTLPSLYVGLSRVRTSVNLRILDPVVDTDFLTT